MVKTKVKLCGRLSPQGDFVCVERDKGNRDQVPLSTPLTEYANLVYLEGELESAIPAQGPRCLTLSVVPKLIKKVQHGTSVNEVSIIGKVLGIPNLRNSPKKRLLICELIILVCEQSKQILVPCVAFGRVAKVLASQKDSDISINGRFYCRRTDEGTAYEIAIRSFECKK